MTILYKDLNAQQKAGFDRQMARLGLKPTDLCFEGVLDTRDAGTQGMLALSAATRTVQLKPISIPVTSMAQLNQMVGVPDDHYIQNQYSDRAIQYPPELPQRRQALAAGAKNVCDLEYQLSPEERENLMLAAHAYLHGNSQRVKSYEPLLDALYMPGTLTAITGEAVVVKAGTVLTLGDATKPDTVTAYNFASVTVERGGQIKVVSPINLNTQVFISQ